MKILLVNEASGVHKNLRDGLRELGHQADLVLPVGKAYQGREADMLFGEYSGIILNEIKRNLIYPYKIKKFFSYDLINFVLGVTTLFGYFVRYSDIQKFKDRGILLSYYGVGCDEVSLVRIREDVSKLKFCNSCMKRDIMGKLCKRFILGWRNKASMVSHNFDFSVSSAVCYDHCYNFFPNAVPARIQFPVNVQTIPFYPAKSKKKLLIAHAPTRRGFKGTHIILNVIKNILETNKADFDFLLIEGVSHSEYFEKLKHVDIFIDQLDVPVPGMAALEAMAMGKVVITGNMPEYYYFLTFNKNLPVFHGSSSETVLENTILSVIHSERKLEEIGTASRQFVVDNHDYIKVASLFEKLWSSKCKLTC